MMSKNQNSPQGQKTRSQQVDDVMTRDPVTIAPHATLNAAAHLMWTEECGCLPVVEEDGRVLGILTDRDIAMCSYTQGRPLMELPVRLAMQTEVVCARVGDDREIVEALMEANDVHRLPVLDGDGHVVGIVTRADFEATRERGRERFTMQVAGADLQMTPPASAPGYGPGNGAGNGATSGAQKGSEAARPRS